MPKQVHSLVIIAHNIRSAYNVGSIFRTADGFGAEKIYLTGYSPAPKNSGFQYEKAHEKMIAKTALGAEKAVSWEKNKSIAKVIGELKYKGFQIVALEQSKKSVDYLKFIPHFPLALIIGNEPKGIHGKTLEKCDAIIEIPMLGKKNSLNVAVALGIAGYAIMAKDKFNKQKK